MRFGTRILLAFALCLSPLAVTPVFAQIATTSPSSTTTTPAASQGSAPAAAGTDSAGKCGWTDSWGTCFVNFLGDIIAGIEWIILLVVSALLGIANYLLGWTIYVTVYQFGNLIGNSEGLLAAWSAVRDIANIALLFGFIFMGISTILNLPHSEFTAKRALPTLIIFALLLNFSLLAAEGIIDVSNSFAVSIYNQIGCGGGASSAGDQNCIVNQGIGGRVMDMSGLTGIWNMESITVGKNGQAADGQTKAIIYAGLIVFAVITMIVIAAAAVMLLIRALVLALLMVTAPIGFAGMAIPPLHEMAKKWWTQLLHQAFFAPVYFLLALISISIMGGIIKSLGGDVTHDTLASMFSTASQSGATSNITIGITFALLIGFMMASLIFAKQSAAIGTSTAIKMGGSFALGSLGWVGRNTAGRASYAATQRLQNTEFGTKNRIGIATVGLLRSGSKASYDGRATAAGKGLASQVGNLGTANKGGYDKAIHDQQHKREEQAKEIGNTEEEKTQMLNLSREKASLEKERAEKAQARAEDLKRVNGEIDAEKAVVETELKKLDGKRDEVEALRIELESAKTQAQEMRKKVDEARAAGKDGIANVLNSKAVEAENKARELESTYSSEKSGLENSEQAIKTKLTSLEGERAQIAKDVQAFKDKTSDIDKQMAAKDVQIGEIAGRAKQRKRDFADAIYHPGPVEMTFGRIFDGASLAGDHHAAEKILSESYKSADKILMDNLKKAIEVGEKPDAGHGDDHGGGHDDNHDAGHGGGHGNSHGGGH